jgi:mannosyltransferase OCH1-like enzyme
MSKKIRNIFNNIYNHNKNKGNYNSRMPLINNNPYKNKNINEIKFEIPANIFQTWHTKDLPPLMANSILNIKRHNPNFRYYLYDDNDCREFIKNNFNQNILDTYDNLIPGAYKADLWRYCILYKIGGIYMDIKYTPINGFRFYNLLEKEHLVLDINENYVYNAFMVCKPENQILLKAIYKICQNVRYKNYGSNILEPTGPALLGSLYSNEEKKNFDMKHTDKNNIKLISYNNHNILQSYPGFLDERNKFSKIKHYAVLWKERKVYL